MDDPIPPTTKISLTLGSARKSAHPNGSLKRSHAALHEGDNEDEGDSRYADGRVQTVSHFDIAVGGAIDATRPKKADDAPLVIRPQANRDWKDAGRRKRVRRGEETGMAIVEGVKGDGDDGMREKAVEAQPQESAFGLIRSAGHAKDVASLSANGHSTGAAAAADESSPAEANGKPKSDDDLALEALLGLTAKSTLVLPAAPPAATEEEAFQRDFRSAPDMATLDDYARVPVEQFGAALLRGMGWKDGEGIGVGRGKKAEITKVPTRRPALLGIGAKEEAAAVVLELGAWGVGAKGTGKARGGGRQQQVVYNPVLLRNTKTGELFTEEEVVRRKEREEKRRLETEFEEERRKRRGKAEGDDGRREKEHTRQQDRHRRRERDGGERRRYDGEDESDQERRRRKDKEHKRRERDREDVSHSNKERSRQDESRHDRDLRDRR